MSDILCKWLNEELQLSQTVEPKTFAKNFSNGYLIGEILHKHQLQSDFSLFMKKDTSIAKVNNFSRLEPTLQLLEISFNTNTAQGVMQEKPGVATQLLYELYVSLERKKKTQISGTMMDIVQPGAKAELLKKEHEIYSDHFHHMVKREREQKLHDISQHYKKKSQQWDDRSVMIPSIKQKRSPSQKVKVKDVQRMKIIEKVPKPPPYSSQFSVKRKERHQRSTAQQAQMVQMEIAEFETNRRKLVTCSFTYSSSDQPFPGNCAFGGGSQSSDVTTSGPKLILQPSNKYIQDIRRRLEENTASRDRREKRIDRFLMEQFQARIAEEDARRDEQLVKRLTRQTQEEKRLTTQLLQIRMQKEVIRENRLFREQQYQLRRAKDFQEALEREAVLAQQSKLERAEEIKKELECLNRIAAERAQCKYKKHFASCKGILEQIVDLATKVGEYRHLTANLIPEKLMREWKELLFKGLPLYEPENGQKPGFGSSAVLDPVELEKQEILNNQDYHEYTNMVGEWTWPEQAEEDKLPLTSNNVLGHVIMRLRSFIDQPKVESPSTPFPCSAIKACVLGKSCSGKSTCLAKIAEDHGLCVLSTDTLLEQALEAYHNGEEVTEQQREGQEQQLISDSSMKSDLDTREDSRDSNMRLSTRAMQGAAADKQLREGKAVSDELLVDILVEAIRQVPAQSGWILDGFPMTITLAHLLEKALGGATDVVHVSARTDLAVYPNPPTPPPPPTPALDLALVLDIPDECVVQRAFSHMDTDKPADKTLYEAQTQHRITAFHNTWPKLEKWYGGKQNILVHVDADVAEQELYKRVETVLRQVMMQKQEALVSLPLEDVSSNIGEVQDTSSRATPTPMDPSADLRNEAPEPAESHCSLNEEKDESVKSLSKSNTHPPRGQSRKGSASSVAAEDSQCAPKKPPKSAFPGSSNWGCMDEPFHQELPEHLCSFWDTMCDSYVHSIKTVMQQLRSLRTVVNQQLYNIREDYKHYLSRPDMKQKLVSQWQEDFNSIPDDMREDEETKAELYLRLDELCEHLWDICDRHKEADEQERDAVMGEGWLEDQTAVLFMHHSILIQVELDRFYTTFDILRVYYYMYNQPLPELSSTFFSIPLLDNGKQRDQDERSPSTSGEASNTNVPNQEEFSKPSHEKLISDSEEALTAISNLVTAETEKKALQDMAKAKKKKGPPSPAPADSPTPANDKNSEKNQHKEVKDRICKEFVAALQHEENAAKMRITLVKDHGLNLVQSLQSRAEQTLDSINSWLEELYVAEMKSIDQLSKVVRSHIKAGTRLQRRLMLEVTDFYIIDVHPTVSIPTHTPAVEKTTHSTPTVIQLQSLYQHLCTFAPTGFMSSLEFFRFLRDITSTDMGGNILPDPWIDLNERELVDMICLLSDEYELIDWRRFLLSAALPWPVPTIKQLLDMLQSFKAADGGSSGYINREQYLQAAQWFSSESVYSVTEDSSEPHGRLVNLREFFFQLFADHSVSPPRLDYVSMLLYFAADPNPRQGFIRALSVVLGQHLTHPSPGSLVKSLPRIDESTELSSSDYDPEVEEEDSPCTSSTLCKEQEVSIPALHAVCYHNVTDIKDANRFLLSYPSKEQHTEHLVQIFRKLGHKPEDCVPFSVFCQHPLTQHLMDTSSRYKLVRTILIRGLWLHVCLLRSNKNMGFVFWTFSLLALPVLQSAKILTVCLIGGSHYLLLDEISHNLHQHGHEVRMLLQLGNPVITGFSYSGRTDSYKTSSWSLGEKYVKDYNDWFLEQQTQFLLGRDNFNNFLDFLGHLSYQCNKLLEEKDLITFFQRERYDIIILDAFNPCSFILAHKLGVPYIAFYPGTLNGPLSIALPSPVSYIPVFGSQLSDHMSLSGRVKNLFYSFLAPVGQAVMWSAFREVAERHLASGSPPGGLEELYQGAELWAFNTDFSLEFPQPLMPYSVLVGGLLNKPANPPEQDLQLWISNFGEAGFIVVTLGSMVSSVEVEPLLKEMVAGFSRISQGVLWRYDPKRWPPHIDKPPNLRLRDWLPLNDLLGHEKMRLFISHGGQNSLLQAVYHAVPVLAIPLFGDQFDNVVRAETKGLGLTIKPTHITGELLGSTIQTLLQDVRFKSSARSLSRIHRSNPVPPALRFIQWVEHILHNSGGAHLRPVSLMQPWYQRYLLDIMLLFSLGLAGPVVLCWMFCRTKDDKDKHKKRQ
ncbi:uncharacterized protein V6R79_026395 [Siganus canaliculatus]